MDIARGKICPICGLPFNNLRKESGIFYIDCYRCGNYGITNEATDRVQGFEPNQRIAISSFIFRNQNTKIRLQDIDKLSNLPISIPPEKADKLLLALVKRYPTAGNSFFNLWKIWGSIINQINNSKFREFIEQYKLDLRLIAEAEIISSPELQYIWETFLTQTKQYLLHEGKDNFKISPAGWDHIYSLQSANRDSQSAFIAMRFLKPLTDYCDSYIIPAIYNAGYKPIRVDMEQHNDLIDDRIVASIRRSKFIVVDLTENSYGVYYEAGFARGLGLPVIYLCNKKYFEEKGVHFDINHYSFLLWEDDKGAEILEKLQLRIEATLGRGTYNPEPIKLKYRLPAA